MSVRAIVPLRRRINVNDAASMRCGARASRHKIEFEAKAMRVMEVRRTVRREMCSEEDIEIERMKTREAYYSNSSDRQPFEGRMPSCPITLSVKAPTYSSTLFGTKYNGDEIGMMIAP